MSCHEDVKDVRRQIDIAVQCWPTPEPLRPYVNTSTSTARYGEVAAFMTSGNVLCRQRMLSCVRWQGGALRALASNRMNILLDARTVEQKKKKVGMTLTTDRSFCSDVADFPRPELHKKLLCFGMELALKLQKAFVLPSFTARRRRF